MGKGHFSLEDVQMASKHMQRCLTSLVARAMETKPIIRYHFLASKVAILNKTK